MKTLVYSHLFLRPGPGADASEPMREMLGMWYDHLRGPGCYAGDILLFSNVPGLERPGLVVLPIRDVPEERQRAFLHRVLVYDQVPARDYDAAMQTDLDVLAVSDINELFPRDERLWAAPSDLLTLERRHAWALLPRWRRAAHKFTGWRMRELGVSASVVASAGTAWEKNFGAWARVIRRHGDRPAPPLGDQSFLNLLYLNRTIPIASWSRDQIVHRDWDRAARPCLLHFPGRRKQQIPLYRKV